MRTAVAALAYGYRTLHGGSVAPGNLFRVGACADAAGLKLDLPFRTGLGDKRPLSASRASLWPAGAKAAKGVVMTGLPWTGIMDLPQSGINHTYAPLAYIKADGTPGLRLRKVQGYASWADAQMLLLRQQGIPRVPAGTPLVIILEQRVKNVRADVDGNVKVLVDVIAQALCCPDGDPWNDRDCYLLLSSKVVDKHNPGVTVTITPYTKDCLKRVAAVLSLEQEGDGRGL